MLSESEMDADRQKEIKDRAFAIWEAEGRPDNRAQEHWRQAEAELADDPGSPSDHSEDVDEAQATLGIDGKSANAPVASPTTTAIPKSVERTSKGPAA
jgi:hypothetical protein